MSYGIGLKALKRLCMDQNLSTWHKSNLSSELFNLSDQPAFEWVNNHVTLYHVMPALDTFHAQCPDAISAGTPEPATYYLDLLEKAYAYREINTANIASQNILKDDQDAHELAALTLQNALDNIHARSFHAEIVDLGVEGGKLVLAACMAPKDSARSIFGWPYIDGQAGGVRRGEVVSLVGRPDTGKTFLMTRIAIKNWINGNNVLFVSMEIGLQNMLERLCSVYAHVPISQLSSGGFGSHTLTNFKISIEGMKEQKSKLWVVDGNLAATMEEIYALADQRSCQTIMIDGAYLVRHKNAALDRFSRTAENAEIMKRRTNNIGAATFASWQFNRDASKKLSQKNKADVGLDEIGYSDAVGQISSVVLAVFPGDAVGTNETREIWVKKGRNGEHGQWTVGWDFLTMNFSQLDPEPKPEDKESGIAPMGPNLPGFL